MKKIVVIGGGHAAAQFCASIREAASAETIHLTLVTEEGCLPYQRPPLSKTWIKDENPQPAWLRPASFYADKNIDVRLETKVTSMDATAWHWPALRPRTATPGR